MANEPAKPNKRRIVKPAETVREKTEKAMSQESKKRGIVWLTLGYIAVPFKIIGRLLAGLGHFLGRFKVFRVIGRILLPRYVRQSWKELRLVTWPSQREAIQLTGAVLLFSAIFGVLIAIVDFGLDKLFKQVLLK
ncbi:MAG TPA: preprotein translocase subunit SecE [Candidatus Saccharimonadales bacterium]|nr:preprotein translocase subunit SecE [Candidatus Saccharimonadales bacterium]